MANVTVDIQARVVGYEQSIKSLQAALAKVDPGSDIGKSITKAMEQAQSQVKALSKNMFPKASSDSQIDAIIEKTNRAGEAIQQVASLLQNVQVSDLNLGAFGGDIENFKNQLSSLQTELDSKLNAGIIKAVGESEQLKSVFKELGTDLSKATGATLLEDLSKGAQKAAENVTDLEKKLEKAQTSINNYQTIDSTLKSSRLGTLEGRTALDDELKTITGNYDAVFEQLRATMTSGFSKLKTDTKLDTDGLLKTFFSDLTPENIQSHVQNLFNTLSSQGVFGENEKRKFYESIFGGNDEYNTNNINSLTKSIGLDKAYQQYKAQLQEFYQKIANDIDGKDQAQINRLISTDQLDKAVSATTKALDNAYSKIYNSIKQNQEKLNSALSDKDNIVLQLNTARQTQDTFSSAEQALRQEIEAVRQENKNLENQIAQLREQLNQKLSGEAGNIRNTGATENHNIGSGFRESLEISEAYKNQLAQVAAKEQALGKLQGVVQRWFSIYAAIRMVRQAIDSVISTVKELDSTITEIAIVTSMDQSELWDQMPKYTQLARDYAASISGVYQVSQLYYQQGLQTADVMALTEQTLKMARISGLDYAQATDYMTNAVRSFKMEMTDAQTVVDVYSAIAASSATSVTELASAMSKTASSAEAVGSSFQNTTAMMAVMIEATRESAENIGSAMKSIISRYGEMTSDPSKLVDSEGQEMSLNRVDKALQTVGISIHNAEGEFRNFDEVIMELAEKWNTIDTNTQRYIATIMAGNRQQSRFLALVSSYDRLKELSAEAADSEDASQLQFLKTLDSVAAKQQQIQTNIQSLYTSSGIEDFYKTVLDLGIKITKTFDELGSGNGLIAVISKIGGTFGSLATLVTNVFKAIKTNYSMVSSEITAKAKLATAEKVYAEVQAHADLKQIWSAEVNDWVKAEEQEVAVAKKSALEKVQAERDAVKQQQELRKQLAYENRWQTRGMAVTAVGLGASSLAATMDTSTQRVGKGVLTGIGGAASGIGEAMMLWKASPVVATIMGLVSGLPSILEAMNILDVSISEKVSQMQEDLTSKSDEKIKSQDTFKTLDSYKQKWDELNASQYESNEKREEFLQLNNDIAASYPELISRMDEEGNYIVNMAEGYKYLAEAKREAYKDDLVKAAAQEVSNYEDSDYLLKQIYNTAPLENQKIGLFNLDSDSYEGLLDIDYSQADFMNEVQQIFSARGVTNANMRTAERLFGGKKKDLSTLSITFTDEDSYLTKESENILSQLYLAFIEQIKSGVDQATAETNIISSGEFDSKYNELIKNFDTEFYTQLQKYLNLSNFSDTLSDNKMSTYMTEYIDILSSSAEDMGIESSKIQQRYMKERLLEAWKNSDDKKLFDAETDVEQRKKIIEDFFNKHGNAWYYATFTNQEDVISTLTKEQNEFYENLGKYTLKEVEKIFPDDATMESIFHKDYDDIINNYTEWYNRSNVLFDTITDFSQLFGPEYLSQIQGSYQKIINSASSNTIKNERLKALDDIYNSINQATSLAPEQKNMVLEKVISGDLFSLTGISNLIKTLDAIEGIDFNTEGADIKNSILKFKDFITINLNTEINSVLESYSEELQSLSDSLNKASKGMNLKEAVKAADELGLTLADFNQSGNKFYIKDLTKLKDHYIKVDTEQRADIQKKIDQQKELYQNLETGYMIGSTDSFDFEKYKNLPTLEERRAYYEGYAAELQEFVPLLNTFDKFDTAVMNSPDTSLKQVSEEMQSKVLNRRKNFNLNELLTNKTADDFTKISNLIDEEYATLLSESGINVDSLKNDIKAYLESKSDKSFSQYIAETQGEELAKIYEASEEAVNYLLASTAISQGNLDSLLDLVFGKEGAEGAIKVDRETIKKQIAIGETDNLPKELQKYSTLIQDTFKSVRETTINALISAIGDGSTQIKVTDLNKGILEQLQSKQWIEGDIKTGEYVTIAAQNLLDSAQVFEQYIVSSFNTNAERIKALTETHKNQYANSRVENYGKVAGVESFAYEDLLNYISKTEGFGFLDENSIEDEIKKFGLAFDSMGNVIIDKYDLWITKLESEVKVLAASGANQQELNHAQALLEKTKNAQEQAIATGFDNILKNYSNISIESVEKLANALNMSYTELTGYINEAGEYVEGYLTSNGDGTYQLDTSKLPDLLSKLNGQVSQATFEAIEKSISSIGDVYLSNIKNATSYTTKGASSLADVETFKQSYADIVGKTLSADAFSYNSALQSFVLGESYMDEYINAQRNKLRQLNYSEKFIDQYIKDQTDRAIQDSIALDGFLNATTSTKKSDEANKLIQQIRGLSKYTDIKRQAASSLGREAAYQVDQIQKLFDLEEKATTQEESSAYLSQIEDLIRNGTDEMILRVLESGGQNAVNLLKQIKPEASSDELEAVYNNAINKLRTAQGDLGKGVGETISGLAADIGEVTGALDVVRLDDGTAVITAVHDMVDAYAAIYTQMKNTAGHTIADLNNAYVQLLTAEDQKSVDLIEALNNASGMTYEAMGQIFTRYGIELEQALLDSKNAGIARVGYNKIAITDFTKFKGYIENAIDDTIEVGTQEYLEAYSAYVDSQINMRSQGKNNLQTAFDQLKSVTEAKVGDLLNVTYLEDAFDKSTKTSKDALVQIAEKFGASIKDGILTISKYTDVPGLLQAVAEEAGRAGLLIPEQLAELTDAIADMLSNITSLISSGITGTLNNTDALSLQNWAEKQGLQPLEFNQTAEGLQLTADSLALVYAEMKRVNSLQAQSLLPTIIESNDRYSTLAGTLQAAAEVTQRIEFTRATITNPSRTVMGDVGAKGVALITPVLPDGTELGDDWAKTLATKYANGEINLNTKLQGSDGRELSYTLADVSRGLYTAENAVQQATSAMQSYNEAAESAAGANKDFTASLDSLTAQSSLMSDIVLNKLTNPDAMNFMSDKLPDNYQVAINAWENASKAINTLTTAGKKGYIGVEDFYNIVNTSAGLLEAAGKEFNIKGMNAADLMEAACQHLKVVDGDLKVDLSSAGLDMVTGVDDLKNNLTDGIHELADAEVAILDAEIQVLEVLAAMEAMGDMVVDVDNNGISFELNDMFTFDNGNVKDFTDDMQAFLDEMQGAIKTSDELKEAVYAIQVNGTTLYDLFYGTAKDWEKTFGSAEAASKFMQKLSNIDWGTDINTIQTQIVNAMKDLGQNLVIDVGDNGLVGITAKGQLFNIDLDDKDVAKQAQQAVNAFRTEHPDFFEGTNLRDNVKQLINELNNPYSNQVQVDLQYTLKVVTGEIKIEEEKNKNETTYVGEYAGVKFKAKDRAGVEQYIKQAIDLENQGLSGIKFNAEAGEVSGTLNVGAAHITVTKKGNETTIETNEINGERYDGDSVEEAVKWLAERGYADNSLAGKTWSIKGAFYEVIQDNELGITYTFTRNSAGDSWLYNGQTFHSYDAMAQYIRDIVPLEQGFSDDWHEKAGEQHNEAGQEVKIWTNGTATIEYTLGTGEIIIKADNITFKSRAEADQYLAEKAMADQQKDSGGEINNNTSGGKTIKYTTASGDTYVVEYNSTGKVKTHVTMANTGYSFDAESDTELAMGLAAAAAIAKQEAGELPELNGNQGTVTIHTGGENYEVILDDTGTVTVKDSNGNVQKAISEEVTKNLNQSKIDTNLKATISTAITEALSALPEAINSIEPSNITSVSDALNGITTALAAVVGDSNWAALITQLQNVANAAANIKLPTIGESNGPETPSTPTSSNTPSNQSAQTPVPGPPVNLNEAEGAAEESPELGENISLGLAQGIVDALESIISACSNLAEQTLAKLQAGLKEHSPSEATDEMGQNLDAGLAQGIEKEQRTVVDAGTAVGTAVIEAISTAIAKGMTTLSEGIAEAVESVDKSYTELESKTEQVAGTIRSHWEALVTQITDAVTLIQSLVQSLQEKISITWTIGSEGGKSDLSSSGSGVNKDATRGVTALTEYMDKMLSTMEHNKKDDTFKVTMPTLTIDTSTTKVNIDDIGTKVQEEAAKEPVKEVKVSVGTITADLANVNVDVASINEKVKTETKANPIPSLDTLVNSITPDLTGTTVDTAGINKKVQTEVTKNPISNLNVAVSAITPDVSEATPADIEVFPKPLIIKSAKAKIEKLADPLDLTEINDLGVQTLNENASMVLTDVKAVPTSLSLSLGDTSNVSIDEATPVVLSEPIKIPAEVDIKQAETDIDTLKTKIGEIKQESKPKIFVDINPAISILNALYKVIDEIKQKKIPQITVDTEVAKNSLNQIIGILNTIIEKAQSLMIRITTAQETYQTSELIKTIMKNLITINNNKTITISIGGGSDWQKLISDLNAIAKALERIKGASGIDINLNGGPKETPEEGETPKEGETPEGEETPSENKSSTEDKATEDNGSEDANNNFNKLNDSASQAADSLGEVDKSGTDASKAITDMTDASKTVSETQDIASGQNEVQADQGTVENVNAQTITAKTATAENATTPELTADGGTVDSVTTDNVETGETPKIEAEIHADMTGITGNASLTIDITLDGELPPTGQQSISFESTGITGALPPQGTLHVRYVVDSVIGGPGKAAGTFGLAAGTIGRITGPAHAQSTLMGELGPELVVSNGRYFVAGQNGAEMVNLDKDAIVFNHLQTEQLLKKGMSKERGRAVTNERNAVAFAKGNIGGGPAMASASAALSALKQLRAMWESLRNAKVSDLAGAGGGGGGGGGGGKDDKTTTPKEWVALVERWYNLMQEIDKLEKSITHEEKLRSKIQSDFNKNGTHYARSNQRSLEYLQKQIAAQEQLNISRQKYFDTRRESLKDTPLGQIYEFDSQGQMHFKKNLDPSRFNGFTDAMEWRTWITGMEPNGKARYSNKEKYDQLIAAGFEEYMKYDSSGTEIKRGDFEDADEYYATVTKQVFDRIDEYQEATQSLWDNIQEGYDKILELEEARNQILQEMRDNQLELENQILDAIVDMRQREIDALQEEREKLEETTSRYIEGLTNALDKEQQMYETQQADNDLNQKRRRLSILQRSGGSAEDIANLSREIDEESRDHYFDLQQQQIDAIQEASDQQLQRMDTQIELMTEELEFQKEFGLLWNQVYDVMEMSANQITEFITHGNSEFWSESALGNATKANDILFQAEQWQEQKNDIATIAEDSRARLEDRAYENFNEAMKASYGENYDTNGTYQATFRKTFQETGDITKAGKAAQDAAQQAFMTDQNRLKAQQEGIPYQVSDLSDWWYYVPKNNNVHRAHHYNQGFYTGESRDENHTWDENGLCIKCGHKKTAPQSSSGGWNWGSSSSSSGSGYKVYWKDGKAYTAKSKKEAEKRAKGDVYTSRADQAKKEKRASGGYVGHGLYELGELGTETVLTAEQTQVLRNNILSNRPNSLISLLKSYNQSYNRDSVYKLLKNTSENIQAAMTNNNGVTIENATVNMNVSQIANDYDAKRAGEQALNEMMRIARKTSAGNSLRR